MAINLTPISALPTPPTKVDPINFAARADDFLGALPEFQVELNTSITELNKITSGLDQASPIAAWLVGTTYDFPDVVAGSDGYSYRCIDTGVVGVNPVTDNGTNWLNLSNVRSPIPVGAVVAFIGGYFSDSANGGFVSVIGNTAATLNSVLNPDGWYVCNGAALNSSDSTIFNGAARNLPNITDSRFLMGFTSAGSIGGDNAMAHTHTTDVASFTSGATTLTIAQMPSHTHDGLTTPVPHSSLSWSSGGTASLLNSPNRVSNVGGGESHTHAVDPPSTTSSAASLTENRPKFLSCFYIMKAV